MRIKDPEHPVVDAAAGALTAFALVVALAFACQTAPVQEFFTALDSLFR